MDQSLPPSLPTGTKVITTITLSVPTDQLDIPAGSVAVIIQVPESPLGNRYLIQFPDGQKYWMHRDHFSIHRHEVAKLGEHRNSLDAETLEPHIIYRCVVGSRAFGLETQDSDIDRRGIFLPPADLHWSLQGVPEQFDLQDREECYWEFQKFLSLALKANPNVLECLYSPLIEKTTPLMDELLSHRNIFLSKLVFQTYNGYVLSQFKKLNKDIESRGTVRPKHALHLIRLLISGITIMKDCFVPVEVFGDVREKLLAIKRSKMNWDEVNEWRLLLHKEFTNAFEGTNLPEYPDYEKANQLLIQARRSAL